MKKKYEIICIIQKKAVPLHSQMRHGHQPKVDKPYLLRAKLCTRKSENGALDERFSLWSAKPAKAVRLRHAPLKNEYQLIFVFFVFILVILPTKETFCTMK